MAASIATCKAPASPTNHPDAVLTWMFTSVGATTASKTPAALDNPSEWGRLMKVSHGGKTQVFERDFGNGQKVVTFVIWA